MVHTIIAASNVLHNALEVWFIQNVIFGGAPITLDLHASGITGKTVAYLDYDFDTHIINTLKNNRNHVILYHLGDETAIKDRQCYALADLVLRNYYFEHILHAEATKVRWVPNGYRTGIGPRDPLLLKSVTQRTLLSSFLGWTSNSKSFNNERSAFGSAAAKCGADLYLNETAGFAQGFNISLYSAVLENSIYCPCPAGNSPETIRLYDALEVGAIPIMLDHPFLHKANPVQPVPFPLLSTWEDLPKFLADARMMLQNSSERIQLIQSLTQSWWAGVKLNSQQSLKRHIDNIAQG